MLADGVDVNGMDGGFTFHIAITRLIDALLGELKRGEVFHVEHGYFIILLNIDKPTDDKRPGDIFFYIHNRIRSMIGVYFKNVSVTFKVGGILNGYNLLKNEYAKCVTKINFDRLADDEHYLVQTVTETGCYGRPDSFYVSKEVADIIKYVKENYTKTITLNAMANRVSLSPNYLSSLFKKDTGFSFIECVNLIRINKAKKMLNETHLKIYSVAENAGFNNESYFSRVFKENVGIAPGEYRKQLLSGILNENDD